MKTEFYGRFNEAPLSAAERPKRIFEYYVSGRGRFPADMLRYDACWPVEGDILDTGKRSIMIRSNKEPTIARWASFGWSVGIEDIYGG